MAGGTATRGYLRTAPGFLHDFVCEGSLIFGRVESHTAWALAGRTVENRDAPAGGEKENARFYRQPGSDLPTEQNGG